MSYELTRKKWRDNNAGQLLIMTQNTKTNCIGTNRFNVLTSKVSGLFIVLVLVYAFISRNYTSLSHKLLLFDEKTKPTLLRR